MKKLTKATMAGAAGIALLLGGAGTLAYWNDAATATGGTITAGEMTITAVDDGVWTNGVDDIDDIADFRTVPGDVLTYTADFNVTAVGDNLVAVAALTDDSIVAATAAAPDVKLADLLDDSAVMQIGGVTTTAITPTGGTQVVSVAVSIIWPDGAPADDNDAMNGAVDLENMTITLTQTL